MCRILCVFLVFCASVAFAGDRDDHDGSFGAFGRFRHGGHEPPQPLVYDAQGKFVGALVVNSGVNGVYLDIDGDAVFVELDHKRVGSQVSDSQYQWIDYPSVPYQSQGCSGSVAVADSGGPTPAMPVREGADVTLYIARKEYSGDVHVFSFKQIDSTTGATSCISFPFDEGDIYWAVGHTYPLTQHYPEPLRVVY